MLFSVKVTTKQAKIVSTPPPNHPHRGEQQGLVFSFLYLLQLHVGFHENASINNILPAREVRFRFSHNPYYYPMLFTNCRRRRPSCSVARCQLHCSETRSLHKIIPIPIDHAVNAAFVYACVCCVCSCMCLICIYILDAAAAVAVAAVAASAPVGSSIDVLGNIVNGCCCCCCC